MTSALAFEESYLIAIFFALEDGLLYHPDVLQCIFEAWNNHVINQKLIIEDMNEKTLNSKISWGKIQNNFSGLL